MVGWDFSLSKNDPRGPFSLRDGMLYTLYKIWGQILYNVAKEYHISLISQVFFSKFSLENMTTLELFLL